MSRTETQKLSRRKYEQSEKGRAAKKRHDANYVASGGRKAAENRRAAKPLSEARKNAKKRWAVANKIYFAADRSLRRSLFRNATDFDKFVLIEAMQLAKLRQKLVGGEWEVDHIVPVSKGGTSCFDNIQVVPKLWNKKKSNKHANKFFT